MPEPQGEDRQVRSVEKGVEPQEREFEREKQAFLANLPPEILARYAGQFVAARGGQIVDSDPDLSVLTTRFFRRHGNVSVYITRIGDGQDDLRVDTPFFDEG